jgi:translocator protein
MGQSLVETARGALVPRQPGRVSDADIATALAVCSGAVLASALLSARWSPSPGNGRIRRDYKRLENPPFNPPDAAFAIWGPIYAALTVSGARLWNARPSPARTRALGHWWGIQGLNAFWMRLGFGQRRRGAAALEAAATVVNAAASVETARKVDAPAAWLAVPYAAWIGFAALLSEELWRRNR